MRGEAKQGESKSVEYSAGVELKNFLYVQMNVHFNIKAAYDSNRLVRRVAASVSLGQGSHAIIIV